MIESLIPSDYEVVETYSGNEEKDYANYANVLMSCCRYEYYSYLSFYFRGIADDGTVLIAEYMVEAADVDGTEVDLTPCSLEKLCDRLGELIYEVARKKERPSSEEN